MLLCRLIPHIKLNMNGLSVDASNLLFHIYVYVVNITIKYIFRSSIDTRALQIRLDLRIRNTHIQTQSPIFCFYCNLYVYTYLGDIFFLEHSTLNMYHVYPLLKNAYLYSKI